MPIVMPGRGAMSLYYVQFWDSMERGEFRQRTHDFGTFGRRFPICHPQPRRTLTTLGVIAAANGTRMKMKDL